MLDNEILDNIYNGLRSDDKDTLLKACRLAHEKFSEMDVPQTKLIADALVGQFYLDTEKNMDYVEVIECASQAIAKMGADTVGILIDNLTDTHLQSDYEIVKTLGKIGAPAVAVLKDIFRNDSDPYKRGVALLALSRIDDPALIEIFDEVVAATNHENPELKSMAVEALGTMIECIGGQCLLPDAASEAFSKLMAKIPDVHAGTRANAVRAIGLLGKMGYLSDEQKSHAIAVIEGLLGTDDKHKWDRAFIVRKNASEAYKMLTGASPVEVAPEELCKLED